MRTTWLRGAALLALVLAGCKGNVDVSDAAPEDTQTRLGDKTEHDLAAWLGLPRKELAKLGDEWQTTVDKQLEAIRANSEAAELLPRFLPPFPVAVFHRAKFSPASGLSLPPYLEDGRRDAGLALHLARFGDHEAALQLADPGDSALLRKLRSHKAEKNYPVEWSRLVSLVLTSSQLKLAVGEVEGATDLVQLHKQLAAVLDARAAAGPLGAALLPAGKRALTRAAEAWRDPKLNKTALAGDVEAALGEWGDLPAPSPALAFGASRAEVATLLGQPAKGKAVVAAGEAVARAVDVLGLPLPGEGARAVAAFFDDKGKLAELLVAYNPKLETHYPGMEHLAYPLLERGASAGDEAKTASLQRQTYTCADLRYELLRSNRSLALGALVRVAPAKGAVPAVSGPVRHLADLHLDRGYEATRQAVAPEQSGSVLMLKDKTTLQRVAQAVAAPTPALVSVQRHKNADVVSSLEVTWLHDENATALARLLPALWARFGPAQVEGVEDQGGSYLALGWQDAQTATQLRLPFDDSAPVLLVKDRQPDNKLQARAALAHERDEADREARIAAGKPITRLPRSLNSLNDLAVEGLALGATRAEAEAALPTGRSYKRSKVPGGFSLVVLTTPEQTASLWVRQVLVRYSAGHVSEIRVRYQEGPARPEKGKSPLERLSARAGQPQTLTPPWAGLWTDVGRAAGIDFRRWSDDRTVRTYQRDAGGIEVVLRDRPSGKDAEPAAWLFLPRGVGGAALGESRQAVEAALKAPVSTSGAASVHRAPASSPYEMVLVWYDKDRVSKVLAVHRDRPKEDPAAAAQALARAWGRDVATFGFIRRQDGKAGGVLGANYWHDDRVRIRTFVQAGDQGPRVMTEWRWWPVTADKPATVARTDPLGVR